MPQSNIPLYLILYLSMVPVFAVEHGRCRRIKCEEEESPIHREMLTDNHIPGKKWSIIPHPQVIINPYKKLITGELLKPKNVSALSQRCATCLAIADKLKIVISEAVDAASTDDPVALAQIMRSEAESACETSFKSYDLRRYENDLIVTNTFASTTHVASELDFKWPSVLRKMCRLYVEKTDFLKWYEGFLLGNLDITDQLCRSEGLFRECKNVNYHYVTLGDANYYLAICTCSCSSKDQV